VQVVCVRLKHFTLIALSFQTAGTVEPLFNPSLPLCTVQSLNPLMSPDCMHRNEWVGAL